MEIFKHSDSGDQRQLGLGEPGVALVIAQAKYEIGMPVQHRIYGFRGVIFDVDPVFDNTDEWYDSIPEDVRPRKDQPFYHLLAETAEPDKSPYIAYVSEQNLVPDDDGVEPIQHPDMDDFFVGMKNGRYILRQKAN